MTSPAALRQNAAPWIRKHRWTVCRAALATAVLASLWAVAAPGGTAGVAPLPSGRKSVFEVTTPLPARLVDLPGHAVAPSRRGEPCEVPKGAVAAVVGVDPVFGILATVLGTDGAAASCVEGSTVFLRQPGRMSAEQVRAALSGHQGQDVLGRANAIRSAAIGRGTAPPEAR